MSDFVLVFIRVNEATYEIVMDKEEAIACREQWRNTLTSSANTILFTGKVHHIDDNYTEIECQIESIKCIEIRTLNSL